MQLDAPALSSILRQSLAAGGYADAFYERRVARSFRLQDGHIHEAGISLTAGVGVRVISGQRSGYAHTDDLSPDSLRNTARVAALIARDHNSGEGSAALGGAVGTRDDCYGPLEARALRAGSATYVDLLLRADVAARAFDPRIVAVNATLADELQDVIILTADGMLVEDRRPLVTLFVQCVAQGSARANGTCGDGGRTNLDYFLERSPESIATEAARVATVNSEAVEAPAGDLEVVVGPGSGGVLLHEAVGHGLEGDFNRQGTSLYSGRIGERVASELVTIYDDGNLPQERGSLCVDDEGTPGQHKVLVENGILRGYMQDRLNGALMGVASTGSGRRQSFRYLPQPRMCNTYMAGGESTHDEIVASVKRGLYAKSFAGGQVEISKGDFVFMLAEGYLIENGKLTAPVRGASLIGNGPEVMTRVVMTGNDARFAGRSYTCGKGGQSVPVGVGMPTVKLSRVTVGGSALG
jgi:TldD protein